MASAIVGCQAPTDYVPPPPPEVTVAEPIQQNVTAYLETTGTTAPVEIVEIRARVSGFVQEIHFMPPEDVDQQEGENAATTGDAIEGSATAPTDAKAPRADQATAQPADGGPQWVTDGPGGEVKQGDRLYTIEPDVYQATLNQAKAAVIVTTANAKDAEAKYNRAKPLAEKGAVSPEELYEKAASYAVGLAAIKAAEADVDKANLDLGYTTVRSPINGRVGKTLVDRGNMVSETESTHLTTVIRWDQVYASFNISERELLELRERARQQDTSAQDVDVLIGQEDEKGYPHAGHVEYADLGVDTSTGTFMLRAIFDNEDKVIIPGAFVRVRIPLNEIEGALFVPEQAVGADQQGRFLLAVDDKNTVVRRDVVLGAKYGGMILITEGLKPGEKIIVQGLQRARPGATVAPKTTPLAAPEELLEASPKKALEDESKNPDEPAAEADDASTRSEEQPAS